MAISLGLASALIPLVADVLPPAVRFLVGDNKADSVKRVTDAADMISSQVTKVTGQPINTPEDVERARIIIAENPEIEANLRIELARIDAELARVELDRDRAYLADVQHAREAALKRGDLRGTWMLVAAFVAIVLIVALLVWGPKPLDQTVVGFVIGIGGMFARNVGSAFDFEFGSSRGSKNKEQILGGELAKVQKFAAEQAEQTSVADAAQAVRTVARTSQKLKKMLGSS